jgi:CubicO group peptidase (beta-lactamase class C family)
MSNIKCIGRSALLLPAGVALALAFSELGLSRNHIRNPEQSQSVEFPKTPAGNRAQTLFNLFNDKITILPKEFVRLNCSEDFKGRIPESSWGGAIVQIITMAGSVELVSIEKSEPSEISFTIRSTSGGLAFAIGVSVVPQPPHLINVMSFRPAGSPGAPAQVSPKTAVGGPNLEQVKAYLAEQARQDRFSGAALIARDGKPLLLDSAGMASKRFRAPNRLDTKFNLGSLNKSFTAVAILQLVEAGVIGIDDPIGKYLDIFPKTVAEKVKVRHLLTMGSGWGDYWGHPYYLQHKDEFRTVSQYMEFIKDIPLDFEPGTRTQHSNIGYEVAGALIERISGKDYYSYIREKIYRPSGMIHSDSFDRDSAVENLAVGYTNNHPLNGDATDRQWENTYILSPKGTPAGGGYSTVEDLLKYDTALRAGKLIGRDLLNFMQSGYQGKIGDPFVPQRVLRGAGGASGVSTFLARDVRNGYMIIILTNARPAVPNRLRRNPENLPGLL